MRFMKILVVKDDTKQLEPLHTALTEQGDTLCMIL
jgi:DNA-binding response OmpR family regulator